MSYILDALRRAEAERKRERDHVPGLHTQQFDDPTLAAFITTAPKRPRERWLVLGGIALVTGAAGVVWLIGARPEPVPPMSAPLAAEPVPQQRAAPVVAPTAPVPTPVPVPVPVQAPPAPAPAPVVARPPAAAAALPPPVAASSPARIVALRELPEQLRQQLPPLHVGGAMHSPDPAGRMLILDGQVYREGDRAAPDLVIEEIQARAAVLVWRGGQRFSLPY
jgi:general secretion pathway protein B